MSETLDAAVRAETIVGAYNLLLGRQPENEAAVNVWVGQSRSDVLGGFLRSQEFAVVNGDVLSHFITAATPAPRPSIASAPANKVEWQISGEQAQRLLHMVQTTWSRLGEIEPHWSVLSGEEYRAANIAQNEKLFFDSGAGDVALIEGVLARHGLRLSEFPVALEYGVGVGRVAPYLSAKVKRLIGCDISASHLELARQRLQSRGVGNATLRLSTNMATFGMEEQFDLWFSRIVLQHNPPPIIAMILRRTFGMLAPGGVALFQVPVYAMGYHFNVDEYLNAAASGASIEMHCLPQSAILRLAGERGCELLEMREDDDTGHPAAFVSNTFLFRKTA